MSKSSFTYEYKLLLARIKDARLNSGLTQQEVAKKIGKPQSYVSKIESGERRLDVIELAELLKIYQAPAMMVLHDIFDAEEKLPKKKTK